MTTHPTCSRCGANVAPGASFCSRCGNDVSGEQGHLATQKMASVPAPADPQDEILAQLKKATLGEYEIYGELGRGGMATVYLAHDVALDRKVAIKLMAPALLASGQAMAERFKREARTAAALSHPHVIPIYAVRESPGLLFFVMKYIEGRSLDAVIKERGALPVPMVQVMLAQVAGALGYAHRRGVIHRDMKPANIMLDEDGWAVVTDFGIAKVADARGLTMTGVTIGTPSYMSPEQCGAKEITGASDQYSLGIVAYEMLTGRVPFDADSLMGIMWQHFNDPPPPVLGRRPDCPADLAAAVTRMLAKPPGERWPSMDELVAALGLGALAPNTPTLREIRAMAKGGTGHAVRASHHTPASPVPPSGMVSPEAPTIRSDAMPAGTPPPARPAPTKPVPREPTAPTRVPAGAASMADAPTVRSTPIRVPGAAETRRKRPVALFAGVGLGVVGLAVVAGLMLTGGGPESPAPAGGAGAPAAVAAPVTSVVLNPPATTISVGGEASLTAFAADAAGNPVADRAVAWRSLDTSIATVTAAGLARGQVRGVRAGTADIEATVEGQVERARVTVATVRAPVARVAVTLPQGSVPAGDSVRITAAALDGDGNTLGDRAVAWISSDSTVARVTRAGYVVTLREGSATLTAAAEEQRGQARITVTPARVAEVVVEPTGVSLQVGGADTLRAEPRDAGGNPLAGRPVRWQSADARIATVSAGGVVNARAVGSTTITATVADRSMRVAVSVNAVPVATVELAPQRVEVEAGGTASLTVTARAADRNELRDRAPNWISSNEDVARVSAAGIVTGVSAGDARITARIEGKEAAVTVRVRPAAVATVAVNPPAVTLTEGEGTMLSATPRDAQGASLPDRRVQWRSDNGRVASVSHSGEVKALAAGTARITATAEEKSATVTITVNARTVAVVPPPTPTPAPPRDTAPPVITRPAPPDAGPDAAGMIATRLSAGGKHTCAVARAGVAICWGANERGQLGTAAGQNSTGPVRNPDIRGLTAIVSGAQHTCGIRDDGSAICWGANDRGQLGAATPGRQLSADAVTVAGGRSFTTLTAGDRHTCGLTADGTAWCWGDNGSDQLGTGSSGFTPAQVRGGKKFRVLAAGAKHTCGIGTDGAVLCWGDGFSGQLGRGARESQREPVAVDLDVKATDVASGREHACAVAQTGRVWCWGGNRAGEVGDGSTSERLSPREAQTPRGTRFTSVVAGADFTCALAEGGAGYCWGGNRSGQLGDGSRTNRPTPVAVQASFPFAALVAGEAHTCGLPRGRLPLCWGANTQGQLGDGTVEPRAQPTPVSLDSLRRP
jgi:serine/threonine protein kinase/alpha-tubulin suppressor-like RCC1 family protein